MGHPLPFVLAERLVEIAPEGLDHVFFTNSGSESVDTALKIALAYHRARGEGQRTRLIGREKGYHGVGFGGISVGGLPNNRKWFGSLLPGVDHIRHTLDIERNAFSRGLPEHGVELAEDLERLVALHDASTIAALIIEPVAGSAGVVLPPKGYLERIREICDKHGILLIFDEVITGFGRVGKAFAAERFNVRADLITTAKGLTNGCVPMGAVFVSDQIHDAFMHGPENMIELFHGYTYSGHPVAAAAAVATLDLYEQTGLFEASRPMHSAIADAAHGMRELPNVIDVRNIGLIAAGANHASTAVHSDTQALIGAGLGESVAAMESGLMNADAKRVVVIGSGATAVTLVPAMANTAARVTMLQRSPTWMVSRPGSDAIRGTVTAHMLDRMNQIQLCPELFSKRLSFRRGFWIT
jgi:beta-alanine--pyruvate transaminase